MCDLLSRVEAWIYREARLADEHRYDDWEALWAEDAVYWVPANGDDPDPRATMSIIFDNRSRISTRIRQLKTGRRHSQKPKSSLRRLITNIEILSEEPLTVGANFAVFESRDRGATTWAGRYEYELRPAAADDGFVLVKKTVLLVGNDQPQPTMSFLI